MDGGVLRISSNETIQMVLLEIFLCNSLIVMKRPPSSLPSRFELSIHLFKKIYISLNINQADCNVSFV